MKRFLIVTLMVAAGAAAVLEPRLRAGGAIWVDAPAADRAAAPLAGTDRQVAAGVVARAIER